MGAILYYARAVNNKLLVGLRSIVTQQEAATKDTSDTVNQLLEYVATYPKNKIAYQASDMVLTGHSDASYLNKSIACSQYGAQIFLSEDERVTKLNGPVLTIAQIIKFVMPSAAEVELAGLYVAGKEILPLRHTIIELE